MMADVPLISVVVPTRNRPQMLGEALQGFIYQRFHDFEVIVVDDGSEERIRQGYATLWDKLDERFRLLPLGPAGHPGSGPSQARNAGIAAARGAWIAFCDDDDHWSDPLHLEIVARTIAQRPRMRLFAANQIGVRGGKVEIADWLPDVTATLTEQTRLPDSPVHSPVHEVPQASLIRSRAFVHLNTLIVHRDIVAAVRGFWSRAYYEEDRDFFWRCLDLVETVAVNPRPVAVHNIPDTLTQNNVSTRATRHERWIGRGLVCQHVALTTRTPALIKVACHQYADSLRHFVADLASREHFHIAWRVAIAALLGRFSVKWLLLTLYLTLKAGLCRVTRRSGLQDPAPPPADGQAAGSPLFSVIVPTRNRPGLLAETLRGLREQSCRDVEILVVDDGSSEETRAAYPTLWETLDARFRLLELGPPGHPGNGPSRARNAGIAASRGRFVTFCDDDDHWCRPDHLTIAAQAIAAAPRARLYVGNQIGLRDGALSIEDWLPDLTGKLHRRPRIGVADVHRLRPADLIASGAFPHLNILIVRRDVVEACGGFWNHASYEGDLHFFWRCLDQADSVLFRPTIVSVHNIPDPSRQINVSTTASLQERRLLRAANCRHVLGVIGSRSLASRALALEGDTLRYLSLDLIQAGETRIAARLALQALAGRFSFKWLVYAMLLHFR